VEQPCGVGKVGEGRVAASALGLGSLSGCTNAGEMIGVDVPRDPLGDVSEHLCIRGALHVPDVSGCGFSICCRSIDGRVGLTICRIPLPALQHIGAL
jgi:hypothetical protein